MVIAAVPPFPATTVTKYWIVNLIVMTVNPDVHVVDGTVPGTHRVPELALELR
jgi:hypothetical protein